MMKRPTARVRSESYSLIKKYGLLVMARRQWQLLFMAIPFMLYILINNYFPIWGWSYAFFEATPKMFPNYEKFLGLSMFIKAYSLEKFWLALRNTLGISSLKLITGFISAISLAVLLNEIKATWFKRTVQTISYLPHFISWVVCVTLLNIALSPEDGIINKILVSLNLIDKPKNWIMENNTTFWFLIALSDIWKEVGWSAIIYLAAMTGIDVELYEAAALDGAGRVRRIFAITLPSIYPTIKLLLILSIGGLFSAGFEQLLLLQRPFTQEFSEVLDTYIFKMVWNDPASMKYNIPMATAVGIVNSFISFILVFSANKLAKRLDGEGII